MMKKNSGVLLILIFSMVMIISVNYKSFFCSTPRTEISYGNKLSDEVLNSFVFDKLKQNFRLKDLLSNREYTWVYCYSLHCPACKIVSANIKTKQ